VAVTLLLQHPLIPGIMNVPTDRKRQRDPNKIICYSERTNNYESGEVAI
jgi:hypothetical protein